jgi:hypothetical protein
MTDVFEDQNKDYLTELVGEGKKFKDAAALAKAKVEADNFIEQLKRENANMRQTVSSGEKLDALLDQLKKLQPPSSGNTNTSGNPPLESNPNQNQSNSIKALTVEEVSKLLDDREVKAREQANLNFAVQKVKEAFGANSKSVVEAKASELGMTYESLLEQAKTHPQVFLKLVEANGPTNVAGAPKTQVNSAATKDANGNIKNNAYYAKLRKEMGNAEFFKPAIQNEMERNAKQLGDAFWT